MSESTHEERVQESGVVGHSYDTDDRIGDLDIYEALVNPHEEGAGQKKGGAFPARPFFPFVGREMTATAREELRGIAVKAFDALCKG